MTCPAGFGWLRFADWEQKVRSVRRVAARPLLSRWLSLPDDLLNLQRYCRLRRSDGRLHGAQFLCAQGDFQGCLEAAVMGMPVARRRLGRTDCVEQRRALVSAERCEVSQRRGLRLRDDSSGGTRGAWSREGFAESLDMAKDVLRLQGLGCRAVNGPNNLGCVGQQPV